MEQVPTPGPAHCNAQVPTPSPGIVVLIINIVAAAIITVLSVIIIASTPGPGVPHVLHILMHRFPPLVLEYSLSCTF